MTMRTKDAGGRTVPINDPTSVYSVWLRNANRALMSVPKTDADVRRVLAEELDLLIALMRKIDPDFDNKIVAARNAYSRYYANTIAGLELGNQPMLTLEGSYQQPSLQPKLINTKFVFAWSPKKMGAINHGTFTINLSTVAFLFTQSPSLRTRKATPADGAMHSSRCNLSVRSIAKRFRRCRSVDFFSIRLVRVW